MKLVRCAGQLAWARWLAGDRDRALELADLTEDLLADVGQVFLFGVHAYTGVARVRLDAGAPSRGAARLRPVLEAAERSGWHEATATSALVLGLCLAADGELDGGVAQLERAAATRRSRRSPRVGLGGACRPRAARRGRRAPRSGWSRSAAILERISAGIGDEAVRRPGPLVPIASR